MISKDFFQALDELEETKKISKQFFIDALESALTTALKKEIGEANNASVKLDPEKNSIKITKYKTIVEVVEDPDKEISLEDAKKKKKTYKLGDRVEEEISPKEDFGRIATQAAKQVIMQKLREVEKENIMKEIAEKEDRFLVTTIRRTDDKNVYVDLGINGVDGVMGERDQIPGEKYYPNKKIKVYVKKARADKDNKKNPVVQVSRSNIDFVKKLLEMEIPEITNGSISIMSISREAGQRTKVAVKANVPGLDPVGTCIGINRTRINTIRTELSNEYVDVVQYSEVPEEFVREAMKPAQVEEITMIDEKSCKVLVPDNKLSSAIGKNGINVKLAAKLTGIKIDVSPMSTVNEDAYLANVSFDSDDDTPVGEFNFDDLFKDIE